MIAIPALDLRDGACVQLVGGEYAAERVRLDDPAAVLRMFEECGFVRVHIVDLDAAIGHGSNAAVVRELVEATPLETQVGGGLRSEEHIHTVFDAGARYAVLGTRALEDSAWLADIAALHPGRIIVAADVRDRTVVCAGWKRRTSRNVCDVVAALNALPLAGVLVTAVHREGQLQGTDLALAEEVTASAEWPVFVAGGIASLSDLSALAERGVAGAIIGMALYTGALDPRAVAEEYAV